MEAPRASRLNSTSASVPSVIDAIPSSSTSGANNEEGVSDVDLDMNLLLQADSSANNGSAEDPMDGSMDD